MVIIFHETPASRTKKKVSMNPSVVLTRESHFTTELDNNDTSLEWFVMKKLGGVLTYIFNSIRIFFVRIRKPQIVFVMSLLYISYVKNYKNL